MSYSEVKQKIWSNAISNYVRTFVGMTVGLLTFRLLYQALSKEQFGFWSLLWSVFGYGVLLDFGFGFAAQKRVAELSVSREWEKLSRVLSTILFFYLGIAVVLVTVVALFSSQIVHLFGVSDTSAPEFRWILIAFFIAIGLAFPMGIFPEILRGQQRIRLANNLITTSLVLRLVLIWAAVHWQWSFMTIALIALFFSIAPDVLAAVFALQQMPEVRLRPALFSGSMMRETMTFSIFAYINTAMNIVLGKTDQLVLGTTLGVIGVALYQAGAKVSEVFVQFTRQVQDTISPAAAHLNAHGDKHALADLLVQGTRWSMLIATPLYLLSAFYLTELLRLLTGDASIAMETWLVGQVLLFWFYSSILTHSVSKRIYMMTGHERKLMWLGLAEALGNLALSVTLVLTFRNVICVAVGSLIPSLYIGWMHLWPWMARDAGVSRWTLFKKTATPVLLACVPLAALLALGALPALKFEKAWQTLFTHGPVAGLIASILLWRFALTDAERSSLSKRMTRRFSRHQTEPQTA